MCCVTLRRDPVSRDTLLTHALVLPDTMGDNNTVIGGTLPQLMSSCLATLDVLLQQQHPVVSSMVVAEKYKSASSDSKANIVETVINILGIKDVNSVNPNNTLADVGMDSLMGTEIKQILERNYDIILSAQDIRSLTIAKLQDISSSNSEAVKKPSAVTNVNSSASSVSSANELLMQWPSDELLPKEALVRFKTKSSKGPVLFIIHAIEGLTNSLEYMASQLERPLWGLQCVESAPIDTITELAAFYVNIIRKVQRKGPYNIAGYSFGACVGFEIALQLESAGEKVVLTLIDGSPMYLKQQVDIIGKLKVDDDLTLDSCMKALAYFSTQINKKVTFAQVRVTA